MLSLRKSLHIRLIDHSQKSLIQIQRGGTAGDGRFCAVLLSCPLAFPWSLNKQTWALAIGITCSGNWQVWPVALTVSHHILVAGSGSNTRGSRIFFRKEIRSRGWSLIFQGEGILHLWPYYLAGAYKEHFLSESSLLFSLVSWQDNSRDLRNLLFKKKYKYSHSRADSVSLYLCLLFIFLGVTRSIENNIQNSVKIWSRRVWTFCWLSQLFLSAKFRQRTA